MAAQKKVDYARIEPDWRAGIKSPAQMATEYEAATGTKVSGVAIAKHFKKAGIPRDLTEKIAAKANAMVSEAMVSGKVSAEAKVSEREIVEANATTQAQVRIVHRKDIERARKLSMKLLDELESQTDNLPLFDQLGEMLRSEDDKGVDKLNDIYQAVISLPERTKTMKALSETLKHLIGLEREAFGISSGDGDKTNGMKLVSVKDYTGRG